MTIFGTDISSYQAGLDVTHLPDEFVLMKTTEDVSYVDPNYPDWLAAAKSAGKLLIAYHFIGPSDPAKQAAHLAAHIIDPAVPVMVDFEDEGTFHPALMQLLALDDAIDAVGLHVVLNYFPRWKWGNLGSPSLSGLTQRGIGLVSSAYPNLTVAPAGQVYAAAGGDGGPGWVAYGGVTPTLWQFSDRVADGGQQVDMNAFRGTAPQLAARLNASTPTSNTGSDMALTDIVHFSPELVARYSELASEGFGTEAPLETVLGWMAGRVAHLADTQDAVAAAAVAPVKAELDALIAKVDALPNLINTHVVAGATTDELAAAVMRHLSADTANG